MADTLGQPVLDTEKGSVKENDANSMAYILHIDGRLFVGLAGFSSLLSEHSGQTSVGEKFTVRLFWFAVDGLYPVVDLATIIGGWLLIQKRRKT